MNLAVTHALTGEGHDASEDGTGRGTPLVAATLNSGGNNGGFRTEPGEHIVYQCHGGDVGPMGTLRRGNGDVQSGVPFTSVAYRTSGNCGVMRQGDKTAALNCATDPNQQILHNQAGVRRLMPIECQRLQGLPDDWFDGLGLSNSAKYRMCGNSVAVPCVEWIARRIVRES